MARRRRPTADDDREPAPARLEPVRRPAPISTEPRILCALLLDVSGSMHTALEAVTKALPQFREAVLKNPLLTRRLSWAVIGFADKPTVVYDYGPVTEWEPSAELPRGGGTAMGTAILETLRLQDEHIEAVVSQGISVQHSFCFLVTDGQPNSEPPERFEEAAHLIQQTKRFSFFSIAVEGADIEMLRRLTPGRTPLVLADVKDFSTFFQWLLVSLTRASVTQPGVQIELANPLKTEPTKESGSGKSEGGNPLGWGRVPG